MSKTRSTGQSLRDGGLIMSKSLGDTVREILIREYLELQARHDDGGPMTAEEVKKLQDHKSLLIYIQEQMAFSEWRAEREKKFGPPKLDLSKLMDVAWH